MGEKRWQYDHPIKRSGPIEATVVKFESPAAPEPAAAKS